MTASSSIRKSNAEIVSVRIGCRYVAKQILLNLSIGKRGDQMVSWMEMSFFTEQTYAFKHIRGKCSALNVEAVYIMNRIDSGYLMILILLCNSV